MRRSKMKEAIWREREAYRMKMMEELHPKRGFPCPMCDKRGFIGQRDRYVWAFRCVHCGFWLVGRQLPRIACEAIDGYHDAVDRALIDVIVG